MLWMDLSEHRGILLNKRLSSFEAVFWRSSIHSRSVDLGILDDIWTLKVNYEVLSVHISRLGLYLTRCVVKLSFIDLKRHELMLMQVLRISTIDKI